VYTIAVVTGDVVTGDGGGNRAATTMV